MKLPVCKLLSVITIFSMYSCGSKNYPAASPAEKTPAKLNETLVSNTQIGSFSPEKYNSAFYPTVLDAAKGIGAPFLIQQGYLKVPGITLQDSSFDYNGATYQTRQRYWNPHKEDEADMPSYYVKASAYANYGADNLQSIWPNKCPNTFYNNETKTFTATVDCVGYGSRLLSAVGDGSADKNAYLDLIYAVKTAHNSLFAAKGYVSTAYGFAISFPTLPVWVDKGWIYVSGNIDSEAINTYNHSKYPKIGIYNGVRKGGFAKSLPGDVLAFGNGPGTKYNGHFMVLEEAPQLLNEAGLRSYYPAVPDGEIKKVLAAYHVYAVPLFDDSGLAAHFNDSRTKTSGIGHGTVLVMTSPVDDAPMGLVFKGTATDKTINIRMVSVNNSTSMYALSVGRYK
ncbi:hypothetical protein [Parasediminibacterium sp. JCM 36343]|uniref:hypothetical protein n=1 Tax=Parasediminibacterium sp. JCM 36343 TaxID=3374279 RepID=UPI00397DBE82